MWLIKPLDDILSSGARVAILRVLCESRVPLSGREVGRRSNTSPGHHSRVLHALVRSGAVTCYEHGRVKTYELAKPASPLMAQLRRLFDAEGKRRKEAANALAGSVPGLLSIILFGSEARGAARPGSDTDILLVVERKSKALERSIWDACSRLADRHLVFVSWFLVDIRELRKWDETKLPLWMTIQRDGVVLRGRSLEDLRRSWAPGKNT
jgi:predicted nucleotidyltransferase